MSIRDIAVKIAFAGPRWCWLIGHEFYASFDTKDEFKQTSEWRCCCGATRPADG